MRDAFAMTGFLFLCGLLGWAAVGICQWGYSVYVNLKYAKDALDRVDKKLDRIIEMLQAMQGKPEGDDADAE